MAFRCCFPEPVSRWPVPLERQSPSAPVNEEATGHHLHGFLYNIPWEVDEYGHSGQEAYVTVSVRVDERHPVFRNFRSVSIFSFGTA